MNKPFYRRCTAYIGGMSVPALFHRWDKVVEPNDITTENGKTVTMALPRIVGIIEDDNGCVHVVDAQCIRFADGLSDRLLNKLKWSETHEDE